ALVVDGEPFALDVLAQDGQQRRLLSRQCHWMIDGILEIVSQLRRRSGARHALAQVQLLVLEAEVRLLVVFLAGPPATGSVLETTQGFLPLLEPEGLRVHLRSRNRRSSLPHRPTAGGAEAARVGRGPEG